MAFNFMRRWQADDNQDADQSATSCFYEGGSAVEMAEAPKPKAAGLGGLFGGGALRRPAPAA